MKATILPAMTALAVSMGVMPAAAREILPDRRDAPRSDLRLSSSRDAPDGDIRTNRCLALAVPVEIGEFLSLDMATETACHAEAPRLPLRYDRRAGAPAATAPLSAGTYLGRIALKPGAVFGFDKAMRVVFRQGPVIVQREVHLLAPVRAGQRTFVRASDGEVFSARFQGDVAEEAP